MAPISRILQSGPFKLKFNINDDAFLLSLQLHLEILLITVVFSLPFIKKHKYNIPAQLLNEMHALYMFSCKAFIKTVDYSS